jgi:hypothetical protein
MTASGHGHLRAQNPRHVKEIRKKKVPLHPPSLFLALYESTYRRRGTKEEGTLLTLSLQFVQFFLFSPTSSSSIPLAFKA